MCKRPYSGRVWSLSIGGQQGQHHSACCITVAWLAHSHPKNRRQRCHSSYLLSSTLFQNKYLNWNYWEAMNKEDVRQETCVIAVLVPAVIWIRSYHHTWMRREWTTWIIEFWEKPNLGQPPLLVGRQEIHVVEVSIPVITLCSSGNVAKFSSPKDQGTRWLESRIEETRYWNGKRVSPKVGPKVEKHS